MVHGTAQDGITDAAHVTRLKLAEEEQLLIGKADISNYYHHLQLPVWLQTYLALPSVAAWKIGLTDCHPYCEIWPCCTTLPMGWSHSVRIAQLIHENILYQPHGDLPAALRPEDNILHIRNPDIVRPLHALYVDDSIIFGLASNPVGAREQYERMLQAYAAVGLPVKESKCIRPDTVRTVTALGMDVNGEDGTVSVSAERHHKMILATLHLLWKRNVTGHALSVVIGLWTWNLLLRRPALSTLKCSYSFVEKHRWATAELWPSVRCELVACTHRLRAIVTFVATPSMVELDSGIGRADGQGWRRGDRVGRNVSTAIMAIIVLFMVGLCGRRSDDGW